MSTYLDAFSLIVFFFSLLSCRFLMLFIIHTVQYGAPFIIISMADFDSTYHIEADFCSVSEEREQKLVENY